MQWPVRQGLEGLDLLLNSIPMTLFTVALVLVAWRVAGRGVAIFTLVSLVVLDLIHVWPETMTTLAMVLTAVVFCALAGIPVGILAARSNGFRSEEHTSELQSLMRISYAVFCLK